MAMCTHQGKQLATIISSIKSQLVSLIRCSSHISHSGRKESWETKLLDCTGKAENNDDDDDEEK